jgi:predicted secreted hydrolase
MRRYKNRVIVLFITAFFLMAGCSKNDETDKINIIKALSETKGQDCFEAAEQGKQIDLPGDSGPHDRFQTEWWYYTGNLKTETGRHFGYQLTFFRRALSCETANGQSKWRTRQLYFAHFAVTDTDANQFYSSSRMNRQSIGIAGASAKPYAVWIDNWRAHEKNGQVRLIAQEKDMSLDLTLTILKPIILQGDKGWSANGPGETNASYYYSFPRLATKGKISINNNTFTVQGMSWFDHEWSTTALDNRVKGWDWFSVHLDDGRDVMVCQIRNDKGLPNGFGFGALSYPDGTYDILSEKDFSIHPKGYWKSPETGAEYPSGWQIRLVNQDLVLIAEPVIKNQEHDHAFSYWEGAVKFKGKSTQGLGYVELTGY